MLCALYLPIRCVLFHLFLWYVWLFYTSTKTTVCYILDLHVTEVKEASDLQSEFRHVPAACEVPKVMFESADGYWVFDNGSWVDEVCDKSFGLEVLRLGFEDMLIFKKKYGINSIVNL